MASTDPVLAKESNVTHGLYGCYDLRLIKIGDKSLLIEVTLTIFFDFVPNEDDDTIVWTEAEQIGFAQEWRRQISATWDHSDHDSHKGYSLSLRFDCDIRAAARRTQWQARVFKMAKSSDFRTSAVWRNLYPGKFDAEFDSNDHLLKPGGTQTAMIHEFGHMIGNPDEYKKTSPHYSDTNSVMNLGSTVRSRHLAHFIAWAKPHIDDLRSVRFMMDANSRPMSLLDSLPLVASADAELAIVEAWRDSLQPGAATRFTIRRRDTLEPVPMDRVDLEDYGNLEIVFHQPGAGDSDEIVWQPGSPDSLRAIFIE